MSKMDIRFDGVSCPYCGSKLTETENYICIKCALEIDQERRKRKKEIKDAKRKITK